MSEEISHIHETIHAETTNESTSRPGRIRTWIGRAAAAVALTTSSFAASGEAQADTLPEETQRGPVPEDSMGAQGEAISYDTENQAEIQQSDDFFEKLTVAGACNEKGNRVLDVTIQVEEGSLVEIMRDYGEQGPSPDDGEVGRNSAQGNIEYNREYLNWSQREHLPQTTGKEANLYYHAYPPEGTTYDDGTVEKNSEIITITTPSCSNSENGGGSDDSSGDDGGVGGPETIDTNEIAAGTTPETSAMLSQKRFDEASTAVLATSKGYADALTAGPLAGAVSGPLLLTNTESLHGFDVNNDHSSVAAELERLGTENVYIVGGEEALSSEVAAQLNHMGINVERVEGSERTATALAVANKLEGLGFAAENEVTATAAYSYPDAVTATERNIQRNTPNVLTGTEQLPGTTESYLEDRGDEINQVTVVGGPAAVSDAAERQAATAADAEIHELSGEHRVATSYEVAKEVASESGNITKLNVAPVYDGEYQYALIAGANNNPNSATLTIDREDPRFLDYVIDFINEHASNLETIDIVGNVTDEIQNQLDIRAQGAISD